MVKLGIFFVEVGVEIVQFFKFILKGVLFLNSTYSSVGKFIAGSGSGINSFITTSNALCL